jgi:transcriptional regulator with XRE-family HTH domain
MSPTELRAFRERLQLSRREFAPRLFISEPTLERWERGQGRPREVHLRILQSMAQSSVTRNSLNYFEYDAASCLPAELLRDEKKLVVDTLRDLALPLLEQRVTNNGHDWWLRFDVDWALEERASLALICEGSSLPARPYVSFGLDVSVGGGDMRRLSDACGDVSFGHELACRLVRDQNSSTTAQLRERVFTTGLNPETVRHVIRALRSCWERLRVALLQERGLLPAGDG